VIRAKFVSDNDLWWQDLLTHLSVESIVSIIRCVKRRALWGCSKLDLTTCSKSFKPLGFLKPNSSVTSVSLHRFCRLYKQLQEILQCFHSARRPLMLLLIWEEVSLHTWWRMPCTHLQGQSDKWRSFECRTLYEVSAISLRTWLHSLLLQVLQLFSDPVGLPPIGVNIECHDIQSLMNCCWHCSSTHKTQL
jgi:hypothetical protein